MFYAEADIIKFSRLCHIPSIFALRQTLLTRQTLGKQVFSCPRRHDQSNDLNYNEKGRDNLQYGLIPSQFSRLPLPS
jgi:hypothetical protein